MIRKHWLSLLLVSLYAVTRLIIWTNPSPTFSDVIYAFMPYAHLWAAGETPYLKQWFEYPPATIPIIYLPHLIDMGTLHQLWHVNYYDAFRLELMLIDGVLFVLIFAVLKKLKVGTPVFAGALVYYCLVTAKANHFIYDEPELYFVTAVSGAALLPLLLSKRRGVWARWLAFFWGTALKYINAPLGLVYAGYDLATKRLRPVIMVLALVMVWGLPLAYFRSSLMVSLVYQQIRGIQIESVPATFIRTIDRFTHSEHPVEVFKNYDMVGPVSTATKKVFAVILPGGVAAFLVWQAVFLFKKRSGVNELYPLWATQSYIYLFMLITTVSSTPFFLLHIPLTAAFPYTSWREQLRFTLPSLVIIILSMTKIPDLPVGILSVHILIGWARLLLFALLLVQWVGLAKRVARA